MVMAKKISSKIHCGDVFMLIFHFPLARATMQGHNTENLKQIFPEKELRSLSPNFHIHVAVSDLYTAGSVCLSYCRKMCGPILGIHK
jgi:hypothetical protein